jgi:hypothetical protein
VREGEVDEGRGRDAVGEEADDGGGEGSRLSESQRGAAGRVLDGELLGVLADQRLDVDMRCESECKSSCCPPSLPMMQDVLFDEEDDATSAINEIDREKRSWPS